jgi:hypothetical protein
MKKVYESKKLIFGGIAILPFEDEENSKQYHLVVSVIYPPSTLCLEWVDNANSRLLDCENLNVLVLDFEIQKWILKTLSKQLGVEFANAIKELIDDKKEFVDNLVEIVEASKRNALSLEDLILEDLRERGGRC